MTALAGWQNFYVIVGSSAGALIGLQFVVLSLIASTPTTSADAGAGDAFATPNIVHFGAVLGLSGILSAPWYDIGAAAVLWGLVGLSGVVYAITSPGACDSRPRTGPSSRTGYSTFYCPSRHT